MLADKVYRSVTLLILAISTGLSTQTLSKALALFHEKPAWGRTRLIPAALGRWRQADLSVRCQPDVHKEFQNSQSYIGKQNQR